MRSPIQLVPVDDGQRKVWSGLAQSILGDKRDGQAGANNGARTQPAENSDPLRYNPRRTDASWLLLPCLFRLPETPPVPPPVNPSDTGANGMGLGHLGRVVVSLRA